MLRMYVPAEWSGGDAAYWEENWAGGSLDASRDFVRSHPLHDVLDDALPPEGVFLEGGCGLGQFVRYFRERRPRLSVIGIDFAGRALARLKAADPDVVLAAADVVALPLADGTVDVYYSGGVVEHFEDGPVPALAEARRVLAEGGALLITVPDANPMRRLQARLGGLGRVMNPFGFYEVAEGFGPRPGPRGWSFFQHVFTRAEFTAHLESAGFTVERTLAHEVLWGLFDVRPLHALYRGWVGRSDAGQGGSGTPRRDPALDARRDSGPRRAVRRLLVQERPSPGLRPALSLLRAISPNLRLYVCRTR